MSARETNRQARALLALMRPLPGGLLTRLDLLDSLDAQSEDRDSHAVIARAREIVRNGQ